VPQLDAGRTEGRIFLAEAVDPEKLRSQHPQLFSTTTEVYWDDGAAKVVAVRRTCLGKITVFEEPLAEGNSEASDQAMLEGIRRMGLGCLPWDDESRQLQARILCLRHLQAENGWPDVSDGALSADLSWLAPFLCGMNKAGHLRRLRLGEILSSMLSWEKQRQLEREVPSTYTVASGSKIRIDYRLGEPPVLAVRIQEMFGQATTPAVCSGRLPLLLHLLSPARRPIQVTSDLAGFWQRGYPEVKKELKGRYPKHFWPDDPLTAEAVRGVKRKIV